jgi:lipopolysaccharide export LptBFGC system permease protein LptF
MMLTSSAASVGIAGMMKTRIAVTLLALSFMAAAACFAANPQMGTWKLNEAKSKLAPGMGKNPTVVYEEQKDKIKITVEGVDKDGKPRHGVWIGKFDGKAYPSKGNLSWNSAAYTTVNDRTNDITVMKDGKTMWTGRIEVSKDGKSRTVSVNGTDEKGKKFTSKAVYDKE